MEYPPFKQKRWNNISGTGGTNGPLISETIPNPAPRRRTNLVHFDIDPQNGKCSVMCVGDNG
jgi:hypothetical protein